MLHQSHKLEYFKTENWEDDWIKSAEEIVRAEFERAYKDIECNNLETQMVRRYPSIPRKCSNLNY